MSDMDRPKMVPTTPLSSRLPNLCPGRNALSATGWRAALTMSSPLSTKRPISCGALGASYVPSPSIST